MISERIIITTAIPDIRAIPASSKPQSNTFDQTITTTATTTINTNTMKLSIVIAAPLLAAAGVDASLSRCRAACRGGPAAMNRFCRLPIIPFPAKALCWAASNALRTSTGRTYCYNFCYARWGRKRSVDPEDQEFDEYDEEEFEAEEEYAQYLDEIFGGEEPGEVEGAPEAEATPAPEV